MLRIPVICLLVVTVLGALLFQTGPCRGEAVAAVSPLRAGVHPALEKEFSRRLESREGDESGASLLKAYSTAVRTKPGDIGSTADWLALFAQWVKERPDSHFARTSLGMVLSDLVLAEGGRTSRSSSSHAATGQGAQQGGDRFSSRSGSRLPGEYARRRIGGLQPLCRRAGSPPHRSVRLVSVPGRAGPSR